MNILADELSRWYEEIQPMDFYREIFPDGELDVWREHPEEREEHKYTGIIIEITREKKKNGKPFIKRYTVTDELDEIDRVIWGDNFCLMSPISYIGKERKSENARVMYALVVELDNLIVKKDGTQDGLKRLITQWSERVHWVPNPTYTVASGNGLHLYYVFEEGVPLFKNIVKELSNYKRELTEKIWNRHVTVSHTRETIQQESIFQAFRMVGTITKRGDRVHAFKTGERVSIEYLNKYVEKKNQITMLYKSKLTLAEAKKKYPEWYERRIEKNKPKGHWICKRALYDWWKRKIIDGAVVGHRYYCLMMLSIYAIKCDIPREELENDCFEIAEIFEERTDNENNHFTEKDVIDALQSFEDKGLVTYPVTSISNRSGIHIEKNKRNYRKQKEHIILMNTMKKFKKKLGEEIQEGRPKKEKIVKEYRKNNPMARKSDCIRDTGLSKMTVYKWWN